MSCTISPDSELTIRTLSRTQATLPDEPELPMATRAPPMPPPMTWMSLASFSGSTSMIVALTTYSAALTLPIFAEVPLSTRPLAARSCSPVTSCSAEVRSTMVKRLVPPMACRTMSSIWSSGVLPGLAPLPQPILRCLILESSLYSEPNCFSWENTTPSRGL